MGEAKKSKYRPWHRQEWIVFDRDGRVHGRARGFASDQLSALVPFLYPELEGLYRFQRADNLAIPIRNRRLAEYFPCIDLEECDKRGLGDFVRQMRREIKTTHKPHIDKSLEILQAHFEQVEASE